MLKIKLHKIQILIFLNLFSCNIIIAQNQNPWQTIFEKSNYLSTSDYSQTINYFQNLADNSEIATLLTFGISPQGRELKLLVVSKNKIFDPIQAKKSNDVIILINNGIHSGEIEGKDASMLLLREILIDKQKENLLDHVILLIVPIFNVDGHERKSSFNRINQNGPSEMGWRTTAQNYNLNRDFTKADSPEMKAFLKLFNNWLPDIFIDTHTTDGADYQYTITYGITKHQEIPPNTRNLVNEELIPFFEKDVKEAGFLISPYIDFVDGDLNKGITDWISGPRFSHGYAGVRNRIGLLIETHMLKPYKDRVFSTKALLESVISFCNKNFVRIKEISRQADEFVINNYFNLKKPYPLKFEIIKEPDYFLFKGFERINPFSKIAGSIIPKYTDKKIELTIPYFNKDKIIDSVYLPKAYIIPKEWYKLKEILELHGVKVEKLTESEKVFVEQYKFNKVTFAKQPYEGRLIPTYEYEIFNDSIYTKIGDYLIPINQQSLGIIAYLLEPKSDDSFIKWGLMNTIFERKEYFEAYSMEPIAQKMFDTSEQLRTEFQNKIMYDSTFAKSPRERLNFFYERSPYYDDRLNKYPILRVIK